VTLRDGRTVQGRIVKIDEDSIWVEGGTVEPKDRLGAIGKDVTVQTQGDSDLFGMFSEATWVQRSESGEPSWRSVCVEPEGVNAERADPLCVHGDRVDSVATVRRVAREDVASTDANLDEKAVRGATGQRPLEQSWYGEQTLLVDGASLAVGIAMVGVRGAEAAGLATIVGGYLLGAPIVHLSHGHGEKALGSLGLRLGLPLGGAALTCLAGGCGGGGGTPPPRPSSVPAVPSWAQPWPSPSTPRSSRTSTWPAKRSIRRWVSARSSASESSRASSG